MTIVQPTKIISYVTFKDLKYSAVKYIVCEYYFNLI